MSLDVDERNGIKAVMSTVAGRRFVSDVLDACHFGVSPITTDPVGLAINVGIQEPGRVIFEKIASEQPELTLIMTQERATRIALSHTRPDEPEEDYP